MTRPSLPQLEPHIPLWFTTLVISRDAVLIGGYFLVDCASRDEAVEIAAGLPAAQWATVEVREFGPCFL